MNSEEIMTKKNEQDLENELKSYSDEQTARLTDRLSVLMERLQNSDMQAFDELYEASNRYVYFNVKKFSSDIDEYTASDIMQEVYIKIYSSYSSVKEPQNTLKWIKQITRTTTADHFRKGYSKNESLMTEDKDSYIEDTAGADDLNSSLMIPENIMDDRATQEMLLQIINELPADTRLAVVEFYYNEASIREIAEMLGTTEGAVKTKLSRARKTLEKRILEVEQTQGVRLHSVGIGTFILYLIYAYIRENAVPEAVNAAVKGAVAANASAAAAGTQAAEGGVEAAGGSAEAAGTTQGAAATTGGSSAGTAASQAGTGAAAAGGISAGAKAGIIAAAAVVVVGGGGTLFFTLGSSSPEDTLEKLESAVNSQDGAAVVECFDESTVEYSRQMEEIYGYDMADTLAQMWTDGDTLPQGISIDNILAGEETDGEITVTYDLTITEEGAELTSEGRQVTMVKEGLSWRIKLR